MPQRRTVLAGLAAMPLLATVRSAFAADGGDVVATSAGDVTIHPVSHASLVITHGEDALYFDPAKTVFKGLPAPTAIFITHAHGDHFNADALPALAGDAVPLFVSPQVFDLLPEALKSRATALANGDSGSHGDIAITAVPAYNTTPERLKFHPKGVGNGYVVTIGDKKIYVAGDTEDVPEMRALTDIEVAFLPMNLPNTMSEEQVADAVKAFRPKVVYPYHHRGSDPEKLAGLIGDAAEVRIRSWYPAA